MRSEMLNIVNGKISSREKEAMDELACMQLLRRISPYLCVLPEVDEAIVRRLLDHCTSVRVNEAAATIAQWVKKHWSADEIPCQLLSLLDGNDAPGRWSIHENIDLDYRSVPISAIPPQWRENGGGRTSES